MKKILILAALFAALGAAAQPTIPGTTLISFESATEIWKDDVDALATYFSAGAGTVTSVSVVTANGFAGTVATATSTPAITLTTSLNTPVIAGNGTALIAATTTGSGSTVVLNNGPTLIAPILGTPASGTLTNATGLPVSTGISGLGTGVATFLATPSTANFAAAVTGETGTGAVVFATSPTLVTPDLGTPSAATLTNATGLPVSTGIAGLGTGVATFLATPSSANLISAVTNETGTGALVFATSPTLVTPLLGTPTSGVMTNVTGLPLTTGVTGVLPGANGGTNNAFMDFTGPATTLKTFTLPNASATILTSNAAVTVAQGGTGASTLTGILQGNGTSAFTATAIGGDNTLFGSNSSAALFYTLAVTHNDAAFSIARTSSTMNWNIPNATVSLGGIMSTTTQSIAGAKTMTGLFTGSVGIVGTATSSQAGIFVNGVEEQAFRTVTTTSTLAETDRRVYIGTLSADITLNLPTCNSTRDGWVWSFTKIGSDAFAGIVDPNSTETIDGSTTKSIYSQYTTYACQCVSGSGWYSVSAGK